MEIPNFSSDAYSVAFRERAPCGGDAWSREARIVVALAARAGIALDEEALLVCDVRALQALQRVLRYEVGKRRLPKAAARVAYRDSRDRLLGRRKEPMRDTCHARWD